MSQIANSRESLRAEEGQAKAAGVPQAKAKPASKERSEPKKAVPPPVKKAATPKPGGGKTARRRVVFQVAAEPGSEVYVAGSFNGWEPDKYRMKDKTGRGNFERQIYTTPGPLEYKFVINGEWVIDARCPSWVPNTMGSLNSVIEIR